MISFGSSERILSVADGLCLECGNPVTHLLREKFGTISDRMNFGDPLRVERSVNASKTFFDFNLRSTLIINASRVNIIHDDKVHFVQPARVSSRRKSLLALVNEQLPGSI
jgi:hypothetical protein